MSLPKLNHPTFTLVQPSTGKQLSFRPFTGREQKSLLIAKESEDQTDVVRAVADVVGSCFGIDAGKVPMFDLEFMFLALRSKSVENTVKVEVRDDEDGKSYEATVNLDDVKLKNSHRSDAKRNAFEVAPGVGVKLRWPTVDAVLAIGDKDMDVWSVLAASIDSIWDGDEVTAASDVPPAELKEWLMDLPVSKMDPIKEFFEDRPTVEVVVNYRRADGVEVHKLVSGLSSFFG